MTTRTMQTMDVARVSTTAPTTGLMGTYRCTAMPTCTITVDANGQGQCVSDELGLHSRYGVATSTCPTTDYLHYGFWLKKTDADGAVTYNEVETFAGSSVGPKR